MLVGKIVLIAMAWSMIGLGVGSAVGHQVAAIVGSLIYLLVVEDLIGTLLPGVAKFLPSNAADSAVGLWASDANSWRPRWERCCWRRGLRPSSSQGRADCSTATSADPRS